VQHDLRVAQRFCRARLAEDADRLLTTADLYAPAG
jgi:phage tail sheath gpL-like